MNFRLSLPAIYICSAVYPAEADTFFNPAFLSADPAEVASLKQFESGESQLPGAYRVDIYLNQNYVETKDVTFVSDPKNGGDTGLIPAFNKHYWKSLGVKFPTETSSQDLVEKSDENVSETAPIAIAEAIPMAKTEFDFSKQRLNISVPQASMENRARGYISPELWDEGISAMLFNYNFNGSYLNNDTTGSSNTQFLGLNSGLNIGAWRLRNYSTWNKSDDNSNFDQITTTLSRSIIPLKSQIVMGDSNTSGAILDTVPFRGVQLMSDDSMYPDSMRGYAPVVRGIAGTNAKVTIRQNGFTIYQTNVAPGAFVIDDLYATSNSGDLDVEIDEVDGTVNRYTVAYSTLPSLMREGRMQYSITAANYRSGNEQQEEPSFIQGTLARGLAHGISVYSGSQWSDKYRSGSLGLGFNLGELGAISADATHADTTLPDDTKHTGQSFRLQYAKTLNSYGTNIQMMGYRYSTSGYYSFSESTWRSMQGIESVDNDGNITSTSPTTYYNLNNAKRDRIQVSLTQNLWNSASVSVAGNQQTYWNTDNTDKSWQIWYSGRWNYVSYSLSLNYNKSAWSDESDKSMALNIALPLDLLLMPGNGNMDMKGNPMNLNMATTRDSNGNSVSTVGVSGTALEERNLNYSVQQGYRNKSDNGYTGNVAVQYLGGKGAVNAGYSYAGSQSQYTYGASGGVLVHGDGITFSQPLGETNILVAAPGAAGVTLENGSGIKTDSHGYTIMPFATNYRNNRVALNTNSLGDTLDIDDAVVNVVPTRGAVVKAEFKALSGQRAVITLTNNGKKVPFGTVVSVENGTSSGIVDDEGKVYLAGLSRQGRLTAKWGDGIAQHCNADWILPNVTTPVVHVTAKCN